MSRRRQRVARAPIELSISGLSHEGRGVGRLDGKTIFVHGALPGERVSARVTRQRGRFDEAELVSVLEASPQRIEPACPHFGVCGGCSLQHMSEDHQLTHKQSVLLELLQHQAQCQPEQVAEPIRGPQWGYRRKARLGVKVVPAKGGVIIGFRERGKPYVTDCSRCDILDERIGQRLPALRALVQSLSIAAQIPQIEVAIGDEQVALVFRHLAPLGPDDADALERFGEDAGVAIFLQSGGPNTVTPLRASAAALAYEIDGLRLAFQATDFTQVNARINTQLVGAALDYLNLSTDDHVCDLFCGIGNFTLPIAKRAATVIGIEGEAGLVQRAQRNALANQLQNCEFSVADLADRDAVSRIDLGDTNKLLLDPPRTGALELLETLVLERVTHLVYVSCNPVTFARDSALLCQRHGYRLRISGVLDMFPQTAHFESLSLFEKG